MKKTYHTPRVEPLSLTDEDFIALTIDPEGEADPDKAVLTSLRIWDEIYESEWDDEQ